MISLAADNMSVELIALLVLAAFVVNAAGSIYENYFWRSGFLRDMSALELMQKCASTDGERRIAADYAASLYRKADAHLHGRNLASLIPAAFIRGVPGLFLAMVFFAFRFFVDLAQPGASVLDALSVFPDYLIGGLLAEGVFSTLRPFVRPLRDRNGSSASTGGDEGPDGYPEQRENGGDPHVRREREQCAQGDSLEESRNVDDEGE